MAGLQFQAEWKLGVRLQIMLLSEDAIQKQYAGKEQQHLIAMRQTADIADAIELFAPGVRLIKFVQAMAGACQVRLRLLLLIITRKAEARADFNCVMALPVILMQLAAPGIVAPGH